MIEIKSLRKTLFINGLIHTKSWAKAGDIKAQKLLITLSCHKLFPKNNYIRTLYERWENNAYMMFDCILHKNNLKIGKDNNKIIDLFNELALKNNDIGFKYELLSKIYSEEQKEKYAKSILETAILNEYPPALLYYGYDLLKDNWDISYRKKEYYKSSVFSLEELSEKEKTQKAVKAFKKIIKSRWESIEWLSFVGSKYDTIDWQSSIRGISFTHNEISDFTEAIKWYQKAYAIGDEPTMAYRIGILYKEGDKTLKQNYSQAFDWFYKSASKNYMPAQIQLGDMYLNGWGISKNQLEAINWYKKASKHNSFYCSVCYKTDLILNKLGFIDYFKNIKQIYRF